ncbi:hypothetical protein ABT009_31935 [Streptomyces sp. NPDC002896]|uniref:hypothetical protein n=1 Tax=Streptomyces sp. NPDC002896 TaxID=3154438 RepID=UPI003328519E
MVRNVLGSVLALIGATAAVWSPFRVWYDGRLGREYRLGELFSGTGVTAVRAELFGSLFLPFVVAAVVALVGIALRSRGLVALAGLIVLGFAVLWMVRLGLAQGSLTVGGAGPGLDTGVLGAVGGGAVLLLASLVMPGRKRRRGRRRRTTPPAAAEPPTTAEGSRAPGDQPRDEHAYPAQEPPQARPVYGERTRPAAHDEPTRPIRNEPARPAREEPARPAAQDEPTRPIWRRPPDHT